MLGRFRDFLRILQRVRSFDRRNFLQVGASTTRSAERYRRIGLGAISAVFAKGVGFVTSIVSVPLTLGYLGKERYGLWMVISSAIAVLSFADLGIGNGLVNAVSEAHGREDRDMARRYITSGTVMLTAVAFILFILILAVYPIIPWALLANAETPLARKEAGPAFLVFIICVLFSVPAGVVQRVQIGYQESSQSNLWQAAGNILALFAVLGAIHCQLGLPYLVLAMSGTPLLVTTVNWIHLFGKARPWLRPNLKYFERAAANRILRTGAVFVLLQVMAVVGASSDNVIIAQVLGSSSVSEYAVVQRLFAVATITQVFVMPLWPAFGEAIARGDYVWARRTLRWALAGGLSITAMVVAPMILFRTQIITHWVGGEFVPRFNVIFGLALWALIGAYAGVMSTFFNSGHAVVRQAKFYSIAAISSLVLKLFLVHAWGIGGVIWATVIGFGVFYIVPAWITSRRILELPVSATA